MTVVSNIVFVFMIVPRPGWEGVVEYDTEVFKHKEVCELRASVINKFSISKAYYCVDARVNDEPTR